MPRQLDILALEPFFGGARRAMLETVIRCSRHRWTLLKLPPRRIERRLTAAANWFSEQLSRHWSGRVDLLFTSEAMNLANLYRTLPALLKEPSVVYFHDNQLPAPGATGGPLELVNLNTATAATEIWFNSRAHMGDFLTRASALVDRHPELSSHNPMQEIGAKATLMHTPIDLGSVSEFAAAHRVPRDPATIFVETRDADVTLLNEALHKLQSRGVTVRLITSGPVEDLSEDWTRTTVRENDEMGHVAGMLEASVYLSVKPNAPFDYQAIRGMLAGCRPLFPSTGCYPEIVPIEWHKSALYEKMDAHTLAQRLYATIRTSHAPPAATELRQAFRPYEALAACRLFDERLELLASSGAVEK